MATLTNCPHCGKPLVQSAEDLQPKALALLRLIGEMQAPMSKIMRLLPLQVPVRRAARSIGGSPASSGAA